MVFVNSLYARGFVQPSLICILNIKEANIITDQREFVFVKPLFGEMNITINQLGRSNSSFLVSKEIIMKHFRIVCLR